MWQDEESSHMISVNIPLESGSKKKYTLAWPNCLMLQDIFEFGTRGPVQMGHGPTGQHNSGGLKKIL